MQEVVDPTKSRNITLVVTGGSEPVTLYVSTREPNPSEAFYDLKLTCSPGQTTSVEVPKEEMAAAFAPTSVRRKRQASSTNTMYYSMKGSSGSSVKMTTDEVSTTSTTTTARIGNSAGGMKFNAALLLAGLDLILIKLF